jgi:hypothetical protein
MGDSPPSKPGGGLSMRLVAESPSKSVAQPNWVRSISLCGKMNLITPAGESGPCRCVDVPPIAQMDADHHVT